MAVDGDALFVIHHPFVGVIVIVVGVATSGASEIVVDGLPVFFVGVLGVGEWPVGGSGIGIAKDFHVDIRVEAGLEV